jgi:hypothetical protein
MSLLPQEFQTKDSTAVLAILPIQAGLFVVQQTAEKLDPSPACIPLVIR